MRSKEVDAVINKIEKFKTEKCLYKCFDDSDWQEASALLSYISELEKKIKKLENQDEKDFTSIYLKGSIDQKNIWRNKIRDKIKELEEEIERLEKNQNEIIALGGDDLHIREGIWQIEEQIKLLKSIIGE